MKVAWAVVWVVTWAAWAAAAPTKINDESEESDSSIRIIQAEVFTNPSPSSQSSSLHDKRHTITNPGTASLAPTSSVGLSLPSSPSYSNPSSVVRYGVPLDLNPVDPAYRVALTSHDPSPLTPPDFFIHEFEALEDLMKADSLSSGVPLSAGSPRSYQGDGSEVGGQAAAGSVPDPLQVSQIGGLQGDFGDLQIVPGDILNLNSGDFQGFQEASLAESGGGGVALPSTAGGDVNTGVLPGASGVIDVPPGDFGNVGVPLSEAVELNHFSIDPTDVPGTFTASSFDAASLDSLGQLLSDNVEEIQDPGQSLGSFLMEINGKNGMMVLPASELDALQNGQLSVAAVANSSLLTNYQVSTEVDDDDLFDNDIDLNTKDPNDLEVIPSLATILASTASGGTSNDLAVSASAATPDITTPTTTTTTTTTEGPPRLGTILPNLLFSKGQFFGTLFGGLTDIAETIYKAITETDWTAPPPPRSYY